MVERARRLRVGLAHSPPGVLGVTARPNYVGPSGNGLMEADERRAKARRDQGGSNGPPLSVSTRRSRGLRKTPQWEAPRGERPSHWACAARRIEDYYPRLVALRSPHICEGSSPLVSEGMEMPGAPRALREQGRRSFGCLLCQFAGCLKCESEIPRREGSGKSLWRNATPRVTCTVAPRAIHPPRLRGGMPQRRASPSSFRPSRGG